MILDYHLQPKMCGIDFHEVKYIVLWLMVHPSEGIIACDWWDGVVVGS